MKSFSRCLDEENKLFNWLSLDKTMTWSRVMSLGTGRIMKAGKTITKQTNQKCKDKPMTKSVI